MIALALISLIIACIALMVAKSTKEEVQSLRQQLEMLASQKSVADPATPAKKPAKAAKVIAKTNKAKIKTEKPKEAPDPVAVAAPPPVPPTPKGPSFIDRAWASFSADWVIWMAAISLAFGGIFIVQYGLERGFLGPVARVICALGFGTILLGVAQYLHRKPDVGMQGWFAVPVALAGGGIASLYAGVVSAHVLYDLTSPLIGFASMVFVSFLAIGAGLIYGPVLAVVGILGAYVSPLLVTSGETTPILFLYFLAALVAALVVERIQRWIWLSSLAVLFTIAWGVLLQNDFVGDAYFPFYMASIVVIVTSLPVFGLRPQSPSNVILETRSLAKLSEHYPTVLAVITAAVCAVLLFLSTTEGGILYWQTTLLIIIALIYWAIFWNNRAENLDQYAAIFGIFAVLMIGMANSVNDYDLSYSDRYSVISEVGSKFPFAALCVLAIMGAFLLAAFARAPKSVRPIFWLGLSAIIPLVAFGSLYMSWERYDWLSDQQWAGLGLLNGAVLAGCAYLMLRRKFEQRVLAADLFFAAALILAFGAIWLLTPNEYLSHAITALSLVALTLVIKHKFRWTDVLVWGFVTIATIWKTGQLVTDFWFREPLSSLLLLTAGLVALMAIGFHLSKKAKLANRVMLYETAGLFSVAVLACYLIARVSHDSGYEFDYVNIGMFAAVWAMMAAVQYRRMQVVDPLNRARKVFGGIYVVLSLIALSTAVIVSPYVTSSIRGIFPVDSVIAAFGLPCLIFFGMYYFGLCGGRLNKKFAAVMGALSVGFIGVLEIRRFWHGNDVELYRGTEIGELYTYTIILLIATVLTVLLALKRKDLNLRKLGLGLAALTAAKVFLWDMGGMAGLPRATAFIVLGLTLAGVGWLLQISRFEDEPEENNEKGA